MALISSNTLFHFTSSSENLISILRNEFQPRLSLESFAHIVRYVTNSPWMTESGVPMVCFCDIPLSQVGSHMEHYGDYGIGLSKEWGMRHHISPVMYIHGESAPAESAAQLAVLWLKLRAGEVLSEFEPLALRAGALLYFLKAYEGVLERRGKELIEVRFYNEREWRYVPPEVESIPAISRADFADPTKRGAVEAIVAQLPALSFEPQDIRYLVVAKDSEVLPMIHAVRSVKDRYDPDTIDNLTSRIVSAERIRADF
jgi:hypothetical protein